MESTRTTIFSVFLTVALVVPDAIKAQTSVPPNVVVWGDNTFGQTNVPQDLTNAVSLANPGNGFCLALRSDGTVTAWGRNDTGQCEVPANLCNVVSIATSDYAGYALKSDGTVVSWGWLDDINFGTNYWLYVPDTSGLTNIISISGGATWWDAITATNSVIASYYDPYQVPTSLSNPVVLASGQTVNMAVDANSNLIVWGANYSGQTNLPTILRFKNGGVSAIANGSTHCLALKYSSLVAWGDNSYGECTVPASAQSNVVSIAAGGGFSMALTSSGTVIGWGSLAVPDNLPLAYSISAGNGNAIAIVNPVLPGSPPTILTQPISQTVAGDSSVRLFIGAVGFAPVTYQWYFNTTNLIVGATQNFLAITNIQTSQSGQYTVAVSNGAGTVYSQPAFLSVLTSLLIYSVPAISISGGIGSTFNIQYIKSIGPTNQAWTTLATLTLTNSPEFYSDYSAIGQPSRFYRTVLVQ